MKKKKKNKKKQKSPEIVELTADQLEALLGRTETSSMGRTTSRCGRYSNPTLISSDCST